MKSFLLAVVSFAVLPTFAVNDVKVKIANVNIDQSTIEWTGRKVTGKHNGSIALKSGNLEFIDGDFTGGQFEVDMTSIRVLDLQGGSAGKLEGHLKSDDFFGVKTFPSANLEIKDVVAGDNPQTYQVLAHLTIKGITKPVNFETRLERGESEWTASANIKIDRSEFNVRYRSGNFFENLGDKTIYDDFDLKVTLSVDASAL